MAIRHPQAIQRLSGSPATAESRPGTIGRISLASRSKQESAVREIRMLRSTRRGLETWHGRDAVTLATERARQQGTQTSTYTGAPVPDPTGAPSSPRDSRFHASNADLVLPIQYDARQAAP